MEDEKKLIKVEGFNSNLKIGDSFYHIQTEILPHRKVVISQIYHKGEIIHSTIFSFKKQYEEISDLKRLNSGLEKLIHLAHKQSEEFIKSKAKTSPYNSFKQWVSETCKNLENEFERSFINLTFDPDQGWNIFYRKENIKERELTEYKEILPPYLEIGKQLHLPATIKMKTEEKNLFIVISKLNILTAFIFKHTVEFGFINLEMERYFEILKKFF